MTKHFDIVRKGGIMKRMSEKTKRTFAVVIAIILAIALLLGSVAQFFV